MNLNGQADAFVNAWTESQKQMWESWRTFAQSVPTGLPINEETVDEWQKMMQETLTAWTKTTNQTAQVAAERLLASQQVYTGFLDLAAKSWAEIAAQIADGQDWQSTLDSYAEQLRGQLTRVPASMAEANQNVAGLWQAYQKQAQQFVQPWLQLWQQPPFMTGSIPEAASANGSETAMPDLVIPMMNMWDDVVSGTFDAYNQTFGGFLNSPPLGYWREQEEKLRQGFQAWTAFNQATVEYQIMMAEAQVNVFRTLQEELVARSQRGEIITSLEGIAALWSEIADPAFYEIFISDKFVRAQGKLLTATMNYRIQQRKLVELACKQLDIPTRSEVDEAHHTAYNQRKELKALKAQLRTATARIERLQAAVDELDAAQKKAASPAKTSRKSAAQKKTTAKATSSRRTKSSAKQEGSKE